MALVCASFQLGAVFDLRVTNTPLFAIRTGALDYARIVQFTYQTQVVSSVDQIDFGLGRNGAVGTAKRNGISFLSDNNDTVDIGGLVIETEWSVPPTQPTAYFRRIHPYGNNSVVETIDWKFTEPGLAIAPSTSIGFWIVGFAVGAGGTMSTMYFNILVDI